jgi:hypothetical protein
VAFFFRLVQFQLDLQSIFPLLQLPTWVPADQDGSKKLTVDEQLEKNREYWMRQIALNNAKQLRQ